MTQIRTGPRHKHGSPRHAVAKARRNLRAVFVASTAVLALLSPDMALADAGFDAASWQGCYTVSEAKAAGATFALNKLTQGPGYTNPDAACQIASNRGAGLRQADYDFADNASYTAIQSADAFDRVADSMGQVHAGVIPVLDWEPANRRDVAWAKTWLDRVAAHWGVRPMIYMSASTISMADWTPVARADYGLWVAGYPKGYTGERLRNPGPPPYNLGPWPFAAAWQYSSSGLVPGVGSAVDVDWFYGDAATWSRYANAPVGTPANPATPSPTPAKGAPTGDAATLADAVIRGDYGNDPTRRTLLGNRYAEIMAIVNQRLGGGPVGSTANYYTVRSGDCLSLVFGQDWQRIARINGIGWPYTIYPNQRLNTGTGGGGGRSYRVQPGDTLWAISQKLGVPQASIHGYRSGNPSLIYAGEILDY